MNHNLSNTCPRPTAKLMIRHTSSVYLDANAAVGLSQSDVLQGIAREVNKILFCLNNL